MLFTSKTAAILYLRRQDAVLIRKDSSVRLEIAPEFVRNLEVPEPDKLAELAAGFLESNGVRSQQILLILDNSIVFLRDSPADDQTAAKDFESKLPFEPESRQLMTLSQNDKLALFGVNKTLYQAIVQGIQKTNKIKAVVPVASYGIHESNKVDRQAIAAFFNDAKTPRQANFLTKV